MNKTKKDDIKRPKEDIKIDKDDSKFKEVLTAFVKKKTDKNKN